MSLDRRGQPDFPDYAKTGKITAMGIKLTPIPQIPDREPTDHETLLLQLLRERDECIQQLTDENARLKGEKGRPKIKPSRLEPKAKTTTVELEDDSQNENGESGTEKKKRAGSAKRKKTAELPIHETKVIQPQEEIPAGSEFKGYQDYTVQDLIIKPHNIRYRLAIWISPTGEILLGQLPIPVREKGHFGTTIQSYLLYQHYHCRVTQPLLQKQMNELGIDISAGQLNRILVENKEKYHAEKKEILRVGLRVSSYINTDDTSARHQGVNSYCTHIGNQWFAWFETTPSKNRINFLKLLRGQSTDYILLPEALTYMAEHKLPQHQWQKLSLSLNRVFKTQQEWLAYLKATGIEKDSHVKTVTEGALLGAVLASGVSPDLGIISDGAGQFRLLVHGLCWVHAERLINKLIPFTAAQRLAIETVQDQIWSLYQDLKAPPDFDISGSTTT